MAGDSIEMAGKVSEKSLKRAGASVTYAKESFVLGYAAPPARTKERARKVGDSISDLSIVKIIKEEDERRGRWAGKAVDLFGETVNEYSGKVSETFGKAGEEFRETYKTSGLSLAALKSLRHVIQGVFWDATIEPMANITAASVGYIAVNTVAFPVMVVTRSGLRQRMWLSRSHGTAPGPDTILWRLLPLPLWLDYTALLTWAAHIFCRSRRNHR